MDGTKAIHKIGDKEWRKASLRRRAHWLENQIAFHSDERFSKRDESDAAWVRRCKARLVAVKVQIAIAEAVS